MLRAAKLLSSSSDRDSSHEFEQLTEAIADFVIRQEVLGYIDIPRAFVVLLASRDRDGVSQDRSRPASFESLHGTVIDRAATAGAGLRQQHPDTLPQRGHRSLVPIAMASIAK